MVVELVTPEKQKKIFDKLLGYYKKLYPKVKFSKKRKTLSHEEIGKVYYTYAGEEKEATAKEKMAMVRGAIAYGYNTPLVLLLKGKKMILLDGHRRIKVAWKRKIGWEVLIIVANTEKKFGMEKMIIGRIKDFV